MEARKRFVYLMDPFERVTSIESPGKEIFCSSNNNIEHVEIRNESNSIFAFGGIKSIHYLL